jgi:hypothetical protein
MNSLFLNAYDVQDFSSEQSSSYVNNRKNRGKTAKRHGVDENKVNNALRNIKGNNSMNDFDCHHHQPNNSNTEFENGDNDGSEGFMSDFNSSSKKKNGSNDIGNNSYLGFDLKSIVKNNLENFQPISAPLNKEPFKNSNHSDSDNEYKLKTPLPYSADNLIQSNNINNYGKEAFHIKPIINSSYDTTNEVLLQKINYMIHLLEESHDQKTGHVTEELILYSFLGVFIIFTVDSFRRIGKYVR